MTFLMSNEVRASDPPWNDETKITDLHSPPTAIKMDFA